MKLTLVDMASSLVDAATRLGWTEVEKLGNTDIRDVALCSGMALVSPANSLGFMDGGIDYVLSRQILPGIERKVKHAISRVGKVTKLGLGLVGPPLSLWDQEVWADVDHQMINSGPTEFGGSVGARTVLR